MEQIKPLSKALKIAEEQIPITPDDSELLKAGKLLARTSFVSGAKWQKDEDAEILKALSSVYNEYMQSTKKNGKQPYTVLVSMNFQTMQHVATILNKHL